MNGSQINGGKVVALLKCLLWEFFYVRLKEELISMNNLA